MSDKTIPDSSGGTELHFSELEREAVRLLLYGDDPVLEKLRRQFECAQVEKRLLTGVGFFTDMKIESPGLALEYKGRFVVTGVVGEVVGAEHGADFLLFGENGFIEMLEGVSFGEDWAVEDGWFNLGHIGGAENHVYNLRHGTHPFPES